MPTITQQLIRNIGGLIIKISYLAYPIVMHDDMRRKRE
jgi:hypothetical protein